MEKLEQIQQTLSEIDRRVPNALRGLRCRRKPKQTPSERENIARFVASVLRPAPVGREEPGTDYGHDRSAALRMEWASCYLPSPDHDHDVHFGLADYGVVGVADGVGWYSGLGVDAGALANGLTKSACEEVLAKKPGTPVYPHALLEQAYAETAASETPGASTALILSLTGGALRWAYVGNRAFAVLLGGKVAHRSRPQQRRFNCPFQLRAGDDACHSVAGDAEIGRTPARDGDVVVTGTDGLFDAELERVVRMGIALRFSPKNMADVIAGVAYEMSRSRSKDTPYSAGSRKERGDGRRTTSPLSSPSASRLAAHLIS